MRARRTHFAAISLLFTVSLFFVACDDEGGKPSTLDGPVDESNADSAVADRLCYEYRECGCGELAGVSLSGCEQGMQFAFQATVEDAQESGWTYDGDCLARKLNAMLERGCESSTQVVPGCPDEPCQIYYGTRQEGEDCDGSGSASDCAQGLICLGTCQQPCSLQVGPLAEGDTCLDDEGRPTGACDLGLICNQDTRVCSPLPGDGEACVSGQCAEGHWCEVTTDGQTCRAQQPAGADCTTLQECTSLVCDMGTCGPLPGEGEVCAGVCSGDLQCVLDSATSMLTCQAPPNEGEPCLMTATQMCAEGLGCNEGTCEALPGDGDACLLGSVPACEEGLVCGGALCRTQPNAPGCDECDDPDGNCVVQVCMEPPPAVCSDSGGLLF